MTIQDLQALLFERRDEKYAAFTAKLIPTVDPKKIIGVRSPEYPKIIKIIRNDPVVEDFMQSLPHDYHEENCLHAALINNMKDYDACVAALEAFMPFIDNWAVNDAINPVCFHKHHQALLPKVQRWIASEAPYTCRCGLHLFMCNYLDDDFQPQYLNPIADLRSDEYYVKMMTAWLFAEALVKQWDSAIPYIETMRLVPWTHNKTIQKACESFRITEEQKAYLETLRVSTRKKK